MSEGAEPARDELFRTGVMQMKHIAHSHNILTQCRTDERGTRLFDNLLQEYSTGVLDEAEQHHEHHRILAN